jgi:hypothetical protein
VISRRRAVTVLGRTIRFAFLGRTIRFAFLAVDKCAVMISRRRNCGAEKNAGAL